MKLFVIKSEDDQFEKAKQLLERDLTPTERKWLILADEMLRKAERRRFISRMGSRAA
jgi:hypothetical protein